MRQLIAGNWKMNGLRGDAAALASALAGAPGLGCDLLVCPPATLLGLVAQALDGSAVMLGGQDCHTALSGPHTGDISPAMLRDAGAGWVILGHSERRGDHGETDPMVRAKAVAAAGAGLTPIICVGETEQHRLSGNAEFVVASQLDGSVPEGFAGVVAYEPVWAIGTGLTPTPADIAEVHASLREMLGQLIGAEAQTVRILYGGSVKPSNARELMAVENVDGALVGGASLVADDFLGIARAYLR